MGKPRRRIMPSAWARLVSPGSRSAASSSASGRSSTEPPGPVASQSQGSGPPSYRQPNLSLAHAPEQVCSEAAAIAEDGSATQSTNRPQPATEATRADAAPISEDDVFGEGFVARHFCGPSDLTEALSNAMQAVLESDIMRWLPPEIRGYIQVTADSDPYRAAERVSLLVSTADRHDLQRQVLAFIRRRKRLYRYLRSPPRQILWKMAIDKADSRLRKFLQEELNPADVSLHSDILAGCLPGTRIEVLDDVDGAVKEAIRAGGKQVVWLSGVVGAGKTSVMSSMEKRLAESHQVAAFYCSRTRATQSNPRLVFPTLGYHLGLANADVGAALRDIIHHRKESWSAPADQLRTFVLDPLKEATVGPTVILIDGLDECGSGDDLQQLLDAIAGEAGGATSVVFLVSGRPELPISAKLGDSFRTLHLNDKAYDTSVRGDVSRYIDHRLSEDPNFRHHTLPKVRPPILYIDAVNRLSKLADGYFVVASFTCSVVLGPIGRVHFLESTLSLGRIDSHTTTLYQQYRTALESILAQPGWEDDKVKRDVDKVLAILCCAVEALPISTIFQLGTIRDDFVEDILKALSPLLSTSSKCYTFFHASVPEFLGSQSAAASRVDIEAEHGSLFSSCLDILALQLRFNIFDIVDATTELDQTDAEARLSPEARYASICWTQHLAASSFSPAMASAGVATLLESKFLFWLEVLSGLGRVHSDGIGGLNRVSTFLGASAGSIVADCQRCLDQWSSDISSHPCRIYLIVLSWLPPIFRQELCNHDRWILDASPRVLMGAPSRWRDELSIWNLGSVVMSVAWSPDGRLIAAGKMDGTVEIRKSRTGEQHGPVRRGHSNWVLSVAFSPDGSAIVSGSEDRTIRLWDVNSGVTCGEPLEGHTHKVNSVAFSHDGVKLASGSEDEVILLWDVRTGSRIGGPLRGHSGDVYSVAFSPDGSTIASGSDDCTIRLWDASSGAPCGEPLRGHTGSVKSVAFSADGSRVASGSDDGTIRLWDVRSEAPYCEPLEGHTDCVRSVAFSPVGSTIASSSVDSTIRLWDATSGAPHGEPLTGHTKSIRSIAFSPDGSRIVAGSDDETVRLWDVHSGAPGSEPLDGHSNEVKSIAVSPDGSMVASGSVDGTIRLWDVNSEAPCRKVLEGHYGDVNAVVFSPDGLMLASGSGDGTVRLWDTASGALCGESLQGHPHRVLSVAFSPDGSKIASGSSDWTVRLWDAHSGAPCGAPLEGHTGGVWSVAFSPDGSMVASGSSDGTVRLWDATSGVPCGKPLEGHGYVVSLVAFSPDGSTLASGSWDETVRLWHVETGAPLCEPLEGHTDSVWSVAFSEDGAFLVSLSRNEMLMWDFSGLASRIRDAKSLSMRSSTCPTPKKLLDLPSGYIPMVFSPASRTLAGRFGPGWNPVFALRLPSYDPWKTLCDAHTQSRRTINTA